MNSMKQWPALMFAIAALNCSCNGDSSSSVGPEVPGPDKPTTTQLPTTFVGKVVFVRAEGIANFIMAMNPDASSQVSLGVQGVTPHVSPDGRKVAYITPGEGIAVFDLATRQETVVASTRLSIAPKWSRDGVKILFWSNRSGTNELYTMNADGSGVIRLSDGAGGYNEGDYSPDGSRIVFRRVYAGSGGGDLWVMNSDGSSAKRLYEGDAQESDPRWSPDGKQIVFSRAKGSVAEIWVINSDGSNAVRLTNHPGGDWAPRWSPDGSRIVFFRFANSSNESDILTIRPDGTALDVLLGGPTYDHGAVFGPAN